MAVEEMVDETAEAVVGFCAATDDENGQFGAIDDFAGDITHDVGAEAVVGGGGAGDDEVVFVALQFLEEFVEDHAVLQADFAGDAHFFEQLFLVAQAAAEFGIGLENLASVLFGFDQIGVNGGRLGEDVEEIDGGHDAAGDFAGKLDGGVGLFGAAGAEEDAAQGGAFADDDEDGAVRRLQ